MLMASDNHKEYNCGTRCGLCCIVVSSVRLAKWEHELGIYDVVLVPKSRTGDRHRDWSRYVLRQKVIELPPHGKILACVYFDPESKSCEIYERRPEVCRTFNCERSRHWLKMEEEELIKNKQGWAEDHMEELSGSPAV
jgi:Fe-S-cluster containining protein